MMPISASLMIRISRGLVVVVGKLTRERREQEEGQDEEALRDRAELRLLRRVRIELIGDEQHHRLLEQAVVERPRNCVANSGRNRRARSRWVTF